MLIYLGALQPVFAAAAGCLASGGRFAFTVEAADADQAGPAGWLLGEALRFAHAEAYLRDTLAEADLAIEALDRVILRQDRGAPVEGFLVVARRPDTDEAAVACALQDAPAVEAHH